MSSTTENLDALRSLGLFDPDYYHRSYRTALARGETAFAHYLREGDALGFRPSAKFDPVVYRLMHPDVASQNALLHYFGTRPPPEPFMKRIWRTVSRLTGQTTVPPPAWPLSHPYRRVSNFLDQLNLEPPPTAKANGAVEAEPVPVAAAELTDECILTYVIGGSEYRLVTPPPSFFLDRIARNEPFAFARLPHGFWDSLVAVDKMNERVQAALGPKVTREHARLLAIRLLKELKPGNGLYEEHVLDESLACLSLRRARSGLYESVAFRGYPTPQERISTSDLSNESNRKRIMRLVIEKRLLQLQRFFSSDETLFDATLWKRWLITGALKVLPALCRCHAVILVGPESLGGLRSAWKLDKFVHVAIPRANSQRRRHALLDRVSRAIESCKDTRQQSGMHPIVLFQCGGSFAYWLVTELYGRFPDCFLIDMGQAVNAWCYDIEINTRFTWNHAYLRTIIRNNRLESYYRDVMGSGYDELMQRFSEAPVDRAIEEA